MLSLSLIPVSCANLAVISSGTLSTRLSNSFILSFKEASIDGSLVDSSLACASVRVIPNFKNSSFVRFGLLSWNNLFTIVSKLLKSSIVESVERLLLGLSFKTWLKIFWWFSSQILFNPTVEYIWSVGSVFVSWVSFISKIILLNESITFWSLERLSIEFSPTFTTNEFNWEMDRSFISTPASWKFCKVGVWLVWSRA